MLFPTSTVKAHLHFVRISKILHKSRMSTVTLWYRGRDAPVKSLWSVWSGSLSARGWNELMVLADFSIWEGAGCERGLDSVHWRQGACGLLLCAPHPQIPRFCQRTSGAPHPPQSGGRGDAAGGLPVKLEERSYHAVSVHQRWVFQLGVCPCEIYVHYDGVAGLTLLVLHGPSVCLCLCVRHTCAGDNFIFSPFNVTPVELFFHILAFVLQNNVLQRRHCNLKGIVVQHRSENVWSNGLVASPPLRWSQMIILLHSNTVHTIHPSSLWEKK